MKRILSSILVLGLALTGLNTLGFAQEKTKDEYEIITGKVICQGCTLKKEKGAKAQCSIYGHINAIRTKDGKIWTILENDNSTELINNHDYEGSDIEIRGKRFDEARVIEVASFKILSKGEHAHRCPDL
jgi:hypothetical protein